MIIWNWLSQDLIKLNCIWKLNNVRLYAQVRNYAQTNILLDTKTNQKKKKVWKNFCICFYLTDLHFWSEFSSLWMIQARIDHWFWVADVRARWRCLLDSFKAPLSRPLIKHSCVSAAVVGLASRGPTFPLSLISSHMKETKQVSQHFRKRQGCVKTSKENAGRDLRGYDVSCWFIYASKLKNGRIWI